MRSIAFLGALLLAPLTVYAAERGAAEGSKTLEAERALEFAARRCAAEGSKTLEAERALERVARLRQGCLFDELWGVEESGCSPAWRIRGQNDVKVSAEAAGTDGDGFVSTLEAEDLAAIHRLGHEIRRRRSVQADRGTAVSFDELWSTLIRFEALKEEIWLIEELSRRLPTVGDNP